MEQGCEELHASDIDIEQPLEAMQLEGGSKCAEVVVVVADHFDVDDGNVEQALFQA